MSIYSTVDFMTEQGKNDGYTRGLAEGACLQLRKLLVRHGKKRFGPPTPEQQALLESLAENLNQKVLEQVQGRFPIAGNWQELLEGAQSASQESTQPAYLLPYDFDPAPLPPSIDIYSKAAAKSSEDRSMVLHMRFQRLYQKNLGEILYKEDQELQVQYASPVLTVVLLLWPGADGPGVTGEYQPPKGLTYRYQFSKLWEKEADGMLESPGTTALAPLAKFPPERLPEIIRRMSEVISAQPDPTLIGNLWSVAYVSMGLRYSAEQANALLAHALPIIYQQHDTRSFLSTGYYQGLSQGQNEGALKVTRQWIVAMGSPRLGNVPPSVMHVLETIKAVDRLDQIAAKVAKGATWQDVLSLN